MLLNIFSRRPGAKCNRVFTVGTLTEKDDIGGDTEYWRGRLVDPTGSILIYAGQYQPEAAQILANMEAPAFVAVVGKPNLYQTEDGNIIISLRAESIQRVDEATRNQWIMDTARRTSERLAALKNAKPVPCLQRLLPRQIRCHLPRPFRMQKEPGALPYRYRSITGR